MQTVAHGPGICMLLAMIAAGMLCTERENAKGEDMPSPKSRIESRKSKIDKIQSQLNSYSETKEKYKSFLNAYSEQHKKNKSKETNNNQDKVSSEDWNTNADAPVYSEDTLIKDTHTQLDTITEKTSHTEKNEFSLQFSDYWIDDTSSAKKSITDFYIDRAVKQFVASIESAVEVKTE